MAKSPFGKVGSQAQLRSRRLEVMQKSGKKVETGSRVSMGGGEGPTSLGSHVGQKGSEQIKRKREKYSTNDQGARHHIATGMILSRGEGRKTTQLTTKGGVPIKNTTLRGPEGKQGARQIGRRL